ncbi:helix-turn-helix domain-containing protein [Clostridium tarantellae]|uniref:Helix-turn-helix domain-containing protein n=1 Tax=Clostridium tarantellae TaxID=39493 RepID=A0A6I1MM99_9CLOT|nr:helix-turn-helix transcriptional regulator [Clostridium tarantellae]MPQ44505.1 helix-turn-helix domain-containing protein [Clostridium tarantellae]
MDFCNRLKEFRESLELNAVQFSEKLELSKSYYSLIEAGKREPSKTVLYKLVDLSEKPEEWWLYGIEKPIEIMEIREDFKALKSALNCWENLRDNKLKDDDFKNLFNKIELEHLNEIEVILLKALKTDLKHFYTKNRII